LLLGALLATAAIAGEPGDGARFDQIDRDRDRDGRVTAGELPQPALFRRLDRDGNGVIERAEVAAAPAARQRRSAGTGALVMPAEPPHRKHLDIPYAEADGVDPNLLSLDLYVPEGGKAGARPVVVMIHGGGWRNGDKANAPIVGAKMRHFVGHGYVYASINYRLSPQAPEPGGIRHPVHATDTAAAIAWIHDHVAEYGGDPRRLHLMGHSAGGHLAALVATNGRFLAAHGKSPAILASNVLLDPAALDVPGYIELVQGKAMTPLYHLAFGDDAANLRDASPQQHVAAGKGMPPTLVFYAGNRMNLDVIAPAFAAAMTRAGAPAGAVDTVSLDHGQVNSHVGMVDEPMTALIMRLHAGEDPSTFPRTLAAAPGSPATTTASPPPAATAPRAGRPAASPAAAAPAAGAAEGAARSAAGAESASAGISHGVHFTQDYVAGTRDRNGAFMGGTETMRILRHGGALYAGLSYWTDQPGGDPAPGAQVITKRGPGDAWELDASFAGASRISALESITFRSDHRGNALEAPVTLLVADAALDSSRGTGMLRVMVRDDATGAWRQSVIREGAANAFIRAFGAHRDAVTGVDMVFAGTGAGEIYAGSYDPQAAGRIRWNPVPEYANPAFAGRQFTRVSAFCVANDRAYGSVSPHLVERQDGAGATWRPVYTWEADLTRAGAGLRGITAVPAPDGDHQVILGAWERAGRILRIDPLRDFAAVVELEGQPFLQAALGAFRGGRLAAYNRFEPGRHPRTGEPIHWVTLAGVRPDDLGAAWLMLRRADGSYEPLRVHDPAARREAPLVSTRTLEVAPWSDREVYTGGYDGAANNRRNHNTAWIYRGVLPGVPAS
jgi:acetyl esterase/lipase